MGLLDGKVAIVTGAGHGIGRGEALELARQGAKVVVNDVGGSVHGEGVDKRPAEEVADIIRARGGEAAANYDDVADWAGAPNLVRQAVDEFGRLDVLVNNAGIVRDAMLFSMSEDDFDAVVRVHLKGTFATTHHAAVYWREAVQGRAPAPRRHREHGVLGRPAGQRGPGQLRRGQGRHRRADGDLEPGAVALRGAGQRRGPRRHDPHHRHLAQGRRGARARPARRGSTTTR